MSYEYRAIFTADLHFSNKLPYAKLTSESNWITDRLSDQFHVLLQMWDYAKKHEADVWILGDLFDKRLIDAGTLNLSMFALNYKRIEQNVYIIPGNHDATVDDSKCYMVSAFRRAGMDGIVVVDKFMTISPRTGLNFVCVPYASLASNRETIKNAQIDLNRGDNYLILHNSILGSKQGEWVCDSGLDSDEISKGFSHVFAGHFHRYQDFTNGCYVGAPMQLNFGEEGNQKCCWLVTFTLGNYRMKKLPIKAPSFRTFNDLEKVVGCEKGDYVRVVIESTKAEWEKQIANVKASCRQLKESGINAMYVHKPIQQHENRLGKKKDSEVIGMRTMLNRYVELPNVVVGDLSTKRLKQLGLEILESVEVEDESSFFTN